MTFRDIAEKGKPETDNLIVLKIVLRCQNSSHTFSNLFNKKPEDSHLSDVSWTLEHLFLGLLTFWLKGSGGPVRSNLGGLFKDVLPKISRAETEYNVDIWPGGRGAMPPTLPNAVWHEKSPQFGRGSWSEHIGSTNWLYRKTSTVHPKFRLVYVNLTLFKTAYLDLDWWLRIDFTRYWCTTSIKNIVKYNFISVSFILSHNISYQALCQPCMSTINAFSFHSNSPPRRKNPNIELFALRDPFWLAAKSR